MCTRAPALPPPGRFGGAFPLPSLKFWLQTFPSLHVKPSGRASSVLLMHLGQSDLSVCHPGPAGPPWAPAPWGTRVVALLKFAMMPRPVGLRQNQYELLCLRLRAGGGWISRCSRDLFMAFQLTVPGYLRVNGHNGHPTKELWEFLCRWSFSNIPCCPPPLLALLCPPLLPTPALLLPLRF